ncbi:MAG: zinc ribbon domain-containing protein [Lentisphaerota bacterium]
MPIYEYECLKCKKVSNFLVRNISEHKAPACPKCGHKKTQRLMSRFAAASSSKSTGAGDFGEGPGGPGGPGPEGMPDMSMLEGLDEKDPRSMGRVMRKMAEQTGEAMPPEMDEMCRRLEAGEDPEKIEQDMGDLMGDEGAGGGGGGGRDDTLYEA